MHELLTLALPGGRTFLALIPAPVNSGAPVKAIMRGYITLIYWHPNVSFLYDIDCTSSTAFYRRRDGEDALIYTEVTSRPMKVYRESSITSGNLDEGIEHLLCLLWRCDQSTMHSEWTRPLVFVGIN